VNIAINYKSSNLRSSLHNRFIEKMSDIFSLKFIKIEKLLVSV